MKPAHQQLSIMAWLLAVAGLPTAVAMAGAKDTSAAAVAQVAARIDEHLAEAALRATVSPAPLADDAEFLRRVCLDLGGAIPAVSEVRDFLRDPSLDKRARKIDELLAGPRYVKHFSRFWQQVLLPEVGGDDFQRYYQPRFAKWIEQRLREEAPYDSIVWELLTVPLDSVEGPGGRVILFNEPSPLAFYQAKQLAPENLAAATARIFLGLRIECAQCHNHPFDTWKQEQFWSFAAFFAGIERHTPDQGARGPVKEIFDRREIGIPGTRRVMQATYLDGAPPRWRFRVGARQALAEWITAPENRWFSRMAVNRMWAHLFGRGLVDPLDDFAVANPASHPQLLDELAAQFVAHNSDLKFLLRALAASQAYQRSSRQSDPGRNEPTLFARMAVKAFSTEQVLASLCQATGLPLPGQSSAGRVGGIDPAEIAQNDLLDAFEGDTQPATERQMTILQALAMMNGRFMARGTDPERRRLLSAVLDDEQIANSDRIDTLYLATLSRFPRDAERQRLLSYVEQGGPRHDPSRALADVFWALLNTTEFITNH